MPTSPVRNLGGVPEAFFSDHEVQWWYFVRIDFSPDAPGGLRFTQRPNGYVGNLDGSSQTWLEEDFAVAGLAQSNDSALQVSSISFANLEDASGKAPWTEREFDDGLIDRPVTVYVGWWAPDALPSDPMSGLYVIYDGRIGGREFAARASLSLVPHRNPYDVLIGRELIPSCVNIYKDGDTCQYAGGITTCDLTRNGPNGCATHSNLIHFVGFDLMPEPNVSLVWGTDKDSNRAFPA